MKIDSKYLSKPTNNCFKITYKNNKEEEIICWYLSPINDYLIGFYSTSGELLIAISMEYIKRIEKVKNGGKENE